MSTSGCSVFWASANCFSCTWQKPCRSCGLGRQRRRGELLDERRQPRQRLAELAVLVLHDAEEEAGARDVIGRRVADQRFQPGLLVGIVLEAVGLLERLDGGLLLLAVVVDHALVLRDRLLRGSPSL